jgi:hypothetical protein
MRQTVIENLKRYKSPGIDESPAEENEAAGNALPSTNVLFGIR